MKKIILTASLAAILAVPAAVGAASYHYVDVAGTVNTIEAASPSDALLKARLSGKTIHSGVALDRGVLETGKNVGTVYQYIDVWGNVRTITAASVDAAFVLAPDKAPHSSFLRLGVMQ